MAIASREVQAVDSCSYELDALFRVTSVDAGWTRFAVENQAPSMVPPGPLGRSVNDFISDAATRLLYTELFSHAAANERPLVFPIRCDSPHRRRQLELTITPTSESGFRIDSVLLWETPNPGGELLLPGPGRAADPSSLLRVCSWCKKMQVADGWYELDEAARRLRLFERKYQPMLTHGMCRDCYDRMHAVLGAVPRRTH